MVFAAIAVIMVPVAFTQSKDPAAKEGALEVASCDTCKTVPLAKAREKEPAARLAIRARCTFPDGTLVAEQLVEIDPNLSADEKHALAESICKPIMDAAASACDDLAMRVEALNSERALAPSHGSRARQLKREIRKAIEAAPAYCAR
jgi:hypothetical protein